MNRFERRWFGFMFDRPVRRVIFLIPYWVIKMPIYLYVLWRHALQARADRLGNVELTERK